MSEQWAPGKGPEDRLLNCIQYDEHDRPILSDIRVPSINPKEISGAAKPDQTLIPPVASLYEAMVMAEGAKEYGPFNWRESKVSLRTYLAAIKRHWDAVLDGQWLDPKSGYPHLAHIRAGAGIVLDAKEIGNLVDDRPPAGAAPELIAKLTIKTS